MSSLTENKTLLILSLLAVGLAAASPVMATQAAFAQNATSPMGNQTGGNMTGGNSTQPTAFEEANGNSGMIMAVQSNGSQLMVPGQGMMQNQGQMMMIKGSIDVKQAIKDFLRDNVNVTLGDAVTTAEAQVNGTAVEGNLNVVQGFLVYTVIVVDINNEIVHFVVVDAGNGDVLASHAIPASELFAGMHGGMMMGSGPGMMMHGGGGPPMMMQPPQGNQTAGIGA